jgi:hypothetical protein
MDAAQVPKYQRKGAFEASNRHAEWPQVAEAVIEAQQRIRHEYQTPMFPNGFGAAHAICVQAQMSFTVLIKGLHLPSRPRQLEHIPRQPRSPRPAS